jgi:hypothetical protein
MFERGTAVEADTGDAGDCEFHRQHVAFLAGWVVTGCMVDDTYGAVGKEFRRRSVQQPLRPYRTIGKSCSWPLRLLSLGLGTSASFYRCRAVSTARSL